MAVLEEKQAYAFPRKLYNFQPFMNRGRPQLFIKLDPKIGNLSFQDPNKLND